MIEQIAVRGQPIILGHVGEKNAIRVVFDIRNWQNEYGEGVVQLAVQRMGDTEPYPCEVEVDGSHVLWTVNDADTAKSGDYGKCELSYHFGEGRVKTDTFRTVVLPSMGEPSADAPAPYEGWLDNILSAGSEAQLERIKAETAADNAAKSEASAGSYASDALLAKQDAEKTASGIVGYVNAANNSAVLAKGYSDAAERSYQKTATSEANAKLHETNSGNSANAAALSEKNTAALAAEAKTAKEEATEEADRAELAVSHYPKIQNGTWWVWDVEAETYVDTSVRAEGTPFTYEDFTAEQLAALKGDTGNGIKNIVRTSGNGAAGTTDTYTITYTDGTTSTYTVYNGKDGTSVTVQSVSESTEDGGTNVVTFSDGKKLNVKNGSGGKTPVKGTDYWTDADKQEMVNDVTEQVAPVSYNAQTLTEEQKAQARENIGAFASSDAPPPIVQGVGGTVIAVSDSAQRPLKGLRLFGKTTQDGTPTPDAPVELVSVGDKGTINTTACGKNLLNLNRFVQRSGYSNIQMAFSNGVIALSNVSSIGRFACFNVPVVIGQTYTITHGELTNCKALQVTPVDTDIDCWVGYDADGTIAIDDSTRRATFTATKPWVQIWGECYPDTETTFSFADLQIELGDTATEYEPYKPAQTLTAQTPNGLHGIPVKSGGSYTDANGQQWICDVVDLARGKRVHRLYKMVLDGSDDEQWALSAANEPYIAKTNMPIEHKVLGYACSSHYLNSNTGRDKTMRLGGNWGIIVVDNTIASLDEFKSMLTDKPMTLIYEIATPIETDLTAEELAAYAALHTNYPNTTVFNDEGAWMELDYVADTKIYIDNKFAELNAAILSLGGNV